MDWKSCPPEHVSTCLDQSIGTGDGTTTSFQLVKRYGSLFAPYSRAIAKPVAGSILVAVDGVLQTEAVHFDVEVAVGRVVFRAGHLPPLGSVVTAGFEFDVPVRFDTDRLEVNVSGMGYGTVPSIPIVEIRL